MPERPTTQTPVVEPDVSNLRPMPECMYCRGCDQNFVESQFRYTQDVSGYAYGSAWISRGEIEEEQEDSENSDYGDTSYRCGNCDDEISNSQFSQINRLIRLIEQIQQNNFPNSQMTNGFTDSADDHMFEPRLVPVLREKVREGEIEAFNWNYSEYHEEDEPEAQYVAPRPVIPEERDPLDSPIIIPENHQRWRETNMAGMVQCTNKHCHHLFQANEHDEEFICPVCKHEWEIKVEQVTQVYTPPHNLRDYQIINHNATA